MIRKLRRKFILTNMLLVSLVLAAVFAVLVVSNSQRLSAQTMAAMRMALDWSEENSPPSFQFAPPPEAPDGEPFRSRGGRERGPLMMIPVFSASLDDDGRVAALHSRDSVEVSEEVLEQAVSQAVKDGQSTGTLSRLGLRYLAEIRPDGSRRIVFADMSWERENLRGLVLSSLLIGAGALLGFFLISLFLAKRSTRPVERAWEQQRQFVADASHELKTPLTVILANSDILLAHKEDTVERQVKWVAYIQEEARRMRALVEDLLFLAKSDAATAPPNRLPVALSEAVEGCLLPFQSVAFENGVSLDGEIAEGVYVSGDESQLRRLVLILLDNACKYAGAGGRVEVQLCRIQDRVRLSVRNSGAPIPPEHLSRLFDRFYRSDSARTREQGGYGLGLAIAKSIVTGHKGKITAASSEAEGTVFTVLLPGLR